MGNIYVESYDGVIVVGVDSINDRMGVPTYLITSGGRIPLILGLSLAVDHDKELLIIPGINFVNFGLNIYTVMSY
jgi:hypothetical protein